MDKCHQHFIRRSPNLITATFPKPRCIPTNELHHNKMKRINIDFFHSYEDRVFSKLGSRYVSRLMMSNFWCLDQNISGFFNSSVLSRRKGLHMT
jgi:hypothetical protein